MNTNLEKKFEELLFKLSEKYCKHDDSKYNRCIYHIIKNPFIKFIDKYFVAKEKECTKLHNHKKSKVCDNEKKYTIQQILDIIGEDKKELKEIGFDGTGLGEIGYNKAKQEIRDKLYEKEKQSKSKKT